MKLCSTCGSPEHPSWKAHVFKATSSGAVKAKPVSPPRAGATLVANRPAVANRKLVSGDRHRKTPKRAAYMRDLMRARRAAR